MEERSPPVAVRVIRPYADEDALLEAEVGAFSRTGIVLVGAPSRPNGVVLRFEMCLRDGTAVMRGEGRVVGHRAATAQEEGALMLRFTRLDVKSKALLDRAVALREERRSLAPPPPAPPPPPQPSAPPPSAASAAPPAPSVPPQSVRPSGSIAPRMALPSVAPVATPAAEARRAEAPPEPPIEEAPRAESDVDVAVALPEPATPSTTEDLGDDDVEEIDPDEVRAEDEGGLTEQAPPVAFAPRAERPDPILDASTQELPAAAFEAVEAVASPEPPEVVAAADVADVADAEPADVEPADVEPAEVAPADVEPAEVAPAPVVAPPVEIARRPRPEGLAGLAGRTFSPSLDDAGRRAALERLRARAAASGTR